MNNEKSSLLFNNRKVDCYHISDIFDPDKPTSGTNVPSLNSLVIKEDGSLWYISAQDPDTYKSTLSPCSIVSVGGGDAVTAGIISYGADKFSLFIDKRTAPYKLVVDAKLLFYGNNLEEYALYKQNKNGTEECISMYLDTTGKFISNRIPMQGLGKYEQAVNYKWPTNCHTSHELEEGEPILLRVFNNLGNVASEITIYVRNAVWWNDLTTHTNPIVALEAVSNQMLGDDFYIYSKQDLQHLNIQCKVIYADGTERIVPIDSKTCFMYGGDGYMPSYPGYRQTLVFKYFLNHKEQTLNKAEGLGDVRFVTCSKVLTVISNKQNYEVKLSTIPVWDKVEQLWKLKFFAYSDARNRVDDVTNCVTISEDTPFYGDYEHWGIQQHINLTYDIQDVYQVDDPMTGTQEVLITTWNPNDYVKWTLKDTGDTDRVYGADSSLSRRPVVHYDKDLNGYFIPTSIFENWTAMYNSFYLDANPPFNGTTETEPPVPTHFTMRDIDTGSMVVGGAIPVENYGVLVHTVPMNETYVGRSVIIEFLREVDGVMEILYGVPVDVHQSRTGFNDENNNI